MEGGSHMKTIEVPIIFHNGKPWLLLDSLDSSGKLRAVYISKPKQVLDFDKHHCNEVRVKKSIRYLPRKTPEKLEL